MPYSLFLGRELSDETAGRDLNFIETRSRNLEKWEIKHLLTIMRNLYNEAGSPCSGICFPRLQDVIASDANSVNQGGSYEFKDQS